MMKRMQNNGAADPLSLIQAPYARVLVADDVAVGREIAKAVFALYSITIDCVASVQEAVEVIREGRVTYNAVFMDHILPHINGIEAVSIIRNEIKTEYAKTVPIIALTGNTGAGNEELFLNNGFQAFLSKPIHLERLNEVIDRWIRDTTLEDVASIPGIDIVKAMSALSRDERVFIETLKAYKKYIPMLLESVRSCTAETLPDYAVKVHGIKGSSYSISADQVGNLAEALEKAAAAGDIEFVLTHNASFISLIEILIEDIGKFLDTCPGETQKIKKNAPDPALLTALLEACRRYDVVETDNIIQELEQFQYETQAELVTWLREQIDTSGFDQISERLSR